MQADQTNLQGTTNSKVMDQSAVWMTDLDSLKKFQTIVYGLGNLDKLILPSILKEKIGGPRQLWVC